MQQKNSARAFSPSHITGIFVIDIKRDAARSGSMGCGICLEDGAVTTVRAAEETTMKINGKVAEAPTTLTAIKLLTSQLVLVDTTLKVPVGCGFGASGAGTLSTVLALNEVLSLNLTMNELSKAAHVAEVLNRTGLGTVTGEIFGGVVIRKKAGFPFNIDKIPCSGTAISWASFGEISTKSVLSDNLKKKTINKAGKLRLKELLKKPTLHNFFQQSRAFAKEIALASPKVMDAIEAVEAQGGLASQAMLGETVFALNDKGALSEFGEVNVSRISHAGAHLL